MNNTDTFQAGDMTPEDFEAIRAQYDGQRTAQNTGLRPHAMPSTLNEVTLNGAGQVASSSSTSKAQGQTAYAVSHRSGFISIPGMGETLVDAAKAAGLIPHAWKEGDPLPFEAAGGGGNNKYNGGEVSGSGDERGNEPETGKGFSSEAERQVSKASEVLSGVDQLYGAGTTDTLLSDAVAAGDYDPDSLPAGVSPQMAEQVMTGFIASANGKLAKVGSSVTALEEVLTADELRAARVATVMSNTETLEDFGKLATSRLAALPTSNPDAFQALLADMSPEDRKCIKQDRTTGEWTVQVPNEPVLSFGAAILTGKLTF